MGERRPAEQQGEGVGRGQRRGVERELVATGNRRRAAMPQQRAESPEEQTELGGPPLLPEEGR